MKEKLNSQQNKENKKESFDIGLVDMANKITAAFKNEVQAITKIFPDEKRMKQELEKDKNSKKLLPVFNSICAKEIFKYLTPYLGRGIKRAAFERADGAPVHLLIDADKAFIGEIKVFEARIENALVAKFSISADKFNMPIKEIYDISKFLALDINSAWKNGNNKEQLWPIKKI